MTKSRKKRVQYQEYKGSDAMDQAPVYSKMMSDGNGRDSTMIDFASTSVYRESIDYNEELDLQLIALDNIKETMADRVNRTVEMIATPMQRLCYEMVIIKQKGYTEVADELGVDFFSVHSALNGQVDNGKDPHTNGKHYGGLLKRLKGQLEKDPGFQRLIRDRRRINGFMRSQ